MFSGDAVAVWGHCIECTIDQENIKFDNDESMNATIIQKVHGVTRDASQSVIGGPIELGLCTCMI